MKILFVMFISNHVASSEKYSLKYFLTATSGIPNFPEFVGAATVNDVQVGYCDSSIKTAEPKQDWVRKLIKDDPHHLKWYSEKCLGNQQVFRANIDGLRRRLNQTEGPHVLQRMNGCEWDNETDIRGFNQYGYNGEDFIALDLRTLTWIAPVTQAVVTKLKWDTEKARLEYNKYYYDELCPKRLQKYLQYGRSFLQRTELPSVSLLQKTASSPVSCHATGFYPNGALMFWRKDGAEIHDNVEHGEILPNHDETFQMSVDLDVSLIAPEDWRRFDCVFQFSGGENITTMLDKQLIRTNLVSPSEFPLDEVIGGSVGLLLLLVLCVTGLVIWKKKYKGFTPASTSDSSETTADLSEQRSDMQLQ